MKSRSETLRALIAPLCLLALLPFPAHAEDGLFILRMSGGISLVHPEMETIGGALDGSADLGLSQRWGIIGGSHLVLHQQGTTLGFGVGLKALLVERMWWRIYAHIEPELLLLWKDGVQGARADFGFRGGIGFEYLMMWGLGLVIEIQGSLPLGVGSSNRFDSASLSSVAGLFTEF